jgi:hypothetical protein
MNPLDLASAGLWFVAGSCVYAAAMIVADRLLAHAEVVRQLLFLGYLVGAAAYLAVFVGRPLTRAVNPYFAAREIERTLPGAKNSVVNWVDLHDQPMSSTFRNALGLRAARDLRRVDLESAVSGRTAGIAGGFAAVAAGVLVLLLLTMGGSAFFDSFFRAFAPFRQSGPSRTRTSLTLLRPESGNVTVVVGRGLTVAVDVRGKIPDPKGPDAVRLQYRYGEGDPWLDRTMTEEVGNEFSASVSATEVRSGFWYKVTAGDAETPEYRVSVTATPQLTDFQATYHFPKYAAVPKQTRTERALRAVRGSDVVLWALTNRTLREAHLDFDSDGKEGRRTITGQVVPGDPQSFQVRMALTESGRYRLGFTSVEGDVFSEPLHPVAVLEDAAPEVELTRPGADVALPVNGLLTLEGRASDDFGVREMTLRMQVGDRALKPRPYRTPEALHLPGGGYPQVVAYKDSVDLAGIQADDIAPFQPKPGMEIEYWLEAADARQPKPNTGASKHYHVRLGEPQKDEAKRQQDRQQAQKEQQRHEQKQDEQLKKESADRQDQEKQADQKEQEHGKQQDKGKQDNNSKGEKGEAGGQADKKEANGSDQGDPSQQQDQPGEKGSESKPNNGNGAEGSQQQPNDDQKNAENAEKLKNALGKGGGDKKNSSESAEGGNAGDKGQARRPGDRRDNPSDKQPSDATKPDPSSAPDKKEGDKKEGDKKEGDKKEGDKKEGDKKEGDKKEGDKKEGDKSDSGSAKSQAKEQGGKSGESSQSTGGQKSKGESQPDQAKGDEQKPGDKSDSSSAKPQARDQVDKSGSQRNTPSSQQGENKGDKTEKGNQAEPGKDSKGQDKPNRDKPKNDSAPGKPQDKTGDSNDRKGDDKAASQPKNGDRDENNSQPGDKQNTAGEKDKSDKQQGNQSKQGSQGTGQQSNGDKSPDGNDANGATGEKQAPGSKSDKGDDKRPDQATNDKAGAEKAGGANDQPAGARKDGSQQGKPEGEKGNREEGASNSGKPDQRKGEGDPKQGDKEPKGSAGSDASNGDKKEKRDKGEKNQSNAGRTGAGQDKNPDSAGSQSDQKKATPEDVRNALKDLQSNDPAKRAEAEKKLDRMSNEARDRQTRDDARKGLDRAKADANTKDPAAGGRDKAQEKDGAPKQEKNNERKAEGDGKGEETKTGEEPRTPPKEGSDLKGDGKSADNTGQKKGTTDGDPASPSKSQGERGNRGSDKTDEQNGKQSGEKTNGKVTGSRANDKGKETDENNPQQSDKRDPNGKGDSTAAPKGKAGKPISTNTPGQHTPDNPINNERTGEPPAPPVPTKPQQPRHLDKKTELQLEDLDKVTKKDLEAANLTEKDLAALRQWLKEQKKQATADPKESAVAPQQAKGRSFGGARVQPGTGGKPSDLSGGGRALPPPGYQEANEEFKRLLNKSEPNGP